MTKFAITITGLVLAGLLVITQASPIPDDRLDAAFEAAEASLVSLSIPEELKRLADGLRSLNVDLDDLNRIKNGDSYKNDAKRVAQTEKGNFLAVVEQKCDELADIETSVAEISPDTLELISMVESDKSNITSSNKLGELIGYIKLCYSVLH